MKLSSVNIRKRKLIIMFIVIDFLKTKFNASFATFIPIYVYVLETYICICTTTIFPFSNKNLIVTGDEKLIKWNDLSKDTI